MRMANIITYRLPYYTYKYTKEAQNPILALEAPACVVCWDLGFGKRASPLRLRITFPQGVLAVYFPFK